MKKSTCALCALVFIAALSLAPAASALYATTTPWAMYRYDVTHTGATPSTAPANNLTLWHYTVDVGGGYSRQSIPLIVEGMVIFHDGNYAHAVDETTGVELWKSEFLAGGYGGLWPSSVYADGRVYFASSDYIYGRGYVFCVNASTGTLLWTYDASPGRVEGGLTVHDGVVYFGTLNNYLYALNATTSLSLWRYETGGPVYSAPAVEDDMLYVGSDDGRVYALNLSGSTPVQKWNFTADDAVRTPVTLYGDTVYFGTQSATFFAVNKDTGIPVWTYHLTSGGFLDKGIAIADNAIYLAQTQGSWSIHALRVDTPPGNYTQTDPEPRLWIKTMGPGTGLTEPAVADGTLSICSENVLYALNAATGATVWSKTLMNAYLGCPVVADDRVFLTVSNYDKGLYCLGTPYPPVTNYYTVDAGGHTFDVAILTNSTIRNFNTTTLLTDKTLTFTVAGINHTTGMSNITIPNLMLDGTFDVTVDDAAPQYAAAPVNNGTHTALYFTYNNTFPHTVEITGTTVIPEFPILPVLPLLIATLVITLVQLTQRHRNRNRN